MCFSTILFISATEPNHNTPTEHFLHCKDVMEGGWKNRHITNVTLVKGAKVSPCVWINNHFCVLATNSSDGSLPRKGIDRFPMSCRTPAGAPPVGGWTYEGNKEKKFSFPKIWIFSHKVILAVCAYERIDKEITFTIFQKHFWNNSVLIQIFFIFGAKRHFGRVWRRALQWRIVWVCQQNVLT